MAHHALVFGASGILGWAIVNEILSNYPNQGTYSKITALTNRSLSREDALWPAAAPGMPELDIVSGIDLTKGTVEEVKEVMMERVPSIGTVTHVFYFAYLFHPDFPTESELNLGMMQRGFGAVESMAPNLEYVIFPTGSKGYGVHVPGGVGLKAPYKESMPDIPQPYRDELFYFVLRDEFTKMQQDKSWKWAEVRCDIVYGFVPHPNPYNIPAIYMNYLSLYTYMHTTHHPAALSPLLPFPSSPSAYSTLSNACPQDILARFSIHLCLSPRKAGNGQLFNIAGETVPRSMADSWPYVCSLFGLKGIPPLEDDSKDVKIGAFMKKYKDQVKKLEEEKGVTLQVVGLDEAMENWIESMDADHGFVLEKARGVGFREEMGYAEIWRGMIGRYERVGKVYLGW